MNGPVKLSDLNAAGRARFVSVVGPVFERSPWIAERTWPRRPFPSVAALHQALVSIVQESSTDEQLGLIRAHPDLVDRMARDPSIGASSAREQAAAGLDELSAEEAYRFLSFNHLYRERFGFPFVICARENRKDAILAAFPSRLAHSREQEIATALAEIAKIARLRLVDAVTED
jgi:OHCU decarboxylase